VETVAGPSKDDSAISCPVCGAQWPGSFKFCGACGSPLTPDHRPPELEERKIVTALFADLTASTELASRLDPEDLRGILRPFFTAMVEEIERFGGTVEKFIGDAVVAVFGVPVAHEDDPERAVRAALAMQRRLQALNADLRPTTGDDLAMRIGVNTGEVVTAVGIDRDALVTGEVINVAARFEGIAQPGQIVVGERTHRDTRHAVRYRSLGEVTVKGIERPLPAWEAVGEESAEAAVPPGRVGLAPMVGRDEELALLDLLFARVVREGRPGLATLVGPAGIGKSRLSQEFTDRATARTGARTVRGRCLAYGEGLTYWPLAEILKTDAAILDSDPPDAIQQKVDAVIGPRFHTDEDASAHTRVLLASIGVPVAPDPLAGADATAARETIARSWRTYVDSLAGDGPVIALIEDLHWADESLLDLVEGIAARGSSPVLLLCTTRSDLLERRPTWGGGLRSSTTISLSPLSESDGQDLIRHLLGGLPAPDEALGPILQRAEGNPFFAQELLRMVIESGELVLRDTTWILERPLSGSLPDTVQGVLASRIDMISAEEKRVLQDAAVVGRIFWRGAVERLGASDATGALAALVDRGLVMRQPGSQIRGEPEFVFNHVLTQDVAYAGIPKSRRREAHAAALWWVEQVTEGRAEEFAEILAHHADQAGDAAGTARYAALAGHRSRRVFAAPEAIRWYDRALAAAQAPGGAVDAVVADVLFHRGEARELLGSFDAAEADYRRSVEEAAAVGDGLLQARALAALAHLHWLQDRFDVGRAVLEQALDQARGVGANELLAQLLYTAGTLAFGEGKFEEALGRHEEALRIAMEGNDVAGEALARHGLCETLYFLGPFDRALEEGERADRLFRTLGQRPMVYHNLYMVAWILWLKGRLQEAVAKMEESAGGSREIGNRRDEGFALAGMSVAWMVGDLGAAIRAIRRAIQTAVEIQTPRLELAARGVGMQILGETGSIESVGDELRRAMEIIESIRTNFSRPRLLSLAGWFALRRADPSAGDLFEEARRATEGVLLEEMMTAWIEVAAAEDCADPRLARAAGERLASRARGDSPWLEAWGWYGLLLTDALERRWEAAISRTETLTARAVEMGDRTLQWRSAAIRSRALARLDRHAEAEAVRAEAAAIIEAIAATVEDEDLLRSFLARPIVAEVMAEGSATHLLAGVPPDEVAALWSRAKLRRIGNGESLFRRGDPAKAVYVVREGHVVVTVPGENEGTVLARLGPRDLVGEVAVLSEGPRTADALAEGETFVLEIPRRDFLRFVESKPMVAERLLAILGRRLEEDAAALPEASGDDLGARLAEAMERVAASEGRAAPAVEVLPVFLSGGTIRWVRPPGTGSLKIETRAGEPPGDAVVAALRGYGLGARAVHSTSWRTEHDRLVVTYLAVLDAPDVPPPGLRVADVGRSDLARGSATGAPDAIHTEQVLEHALRHFAWLVKDDPIIRDLFAAEWGEALQEYEPEPFRSMDDVRPVSKH